MISRVFLLTLFFSFSLFAQSYPTTFAQLGTPLYSSLSPFLKHKESAFLTAELIEYEKSVNSTLQEGLNADISKDKASKKAYLKSLRHLQKEYTRVLHQLHLAIEDSIKKDDYKTFIKLTDYPFDGLFQNSSAKNQALRYYEKNRTKCKCLILEKSISDTKLIDETIDMFKAEIINSTYSSTSKINKKKKVSLVTTRKNNKIYVTFINKNIYPVTVRVVPMYKNMKELNPANKEFVIPAKSRVAYVSLKVLSGTSYYRYKFSWNIGSKDAVHDDDYIYRLPYKIGTSHMVSQGYNGKATHKGSSAYSIDFPMKIGTKIYAAREGVVVKTKANSDLGGYEKKFASSGNYVKILHSDGTYGIYYHLKYHGVTVKVGEKVSRGEPIGYSGNTGYTSGPHLHFCVAKALSAFKTQTLGVKIDSTDGIITQPEVRHYYKAK